MLYTGGMYIFFFSKVCVVQRGEEEKKNGLVHTSRRGMGCVFIKLIHGNNIFDIHTLYVIP